MAGLSAADPDLKAVNQDKFIQSQKQPLVV